MDLLTQAAAAGRARSPDAVLAQPVSVAAPSRKNLRRSERGREAYSRGLSAEQLILSRYLALGYQLCERRWRTSFAEIDLILSRGDEIIFCEVKASFNHERARANFDARQMRRVFRAADIYLNRSNALRSCAPRFDLGLVDRFGHCKIIEAAVDAWECDGEMLAN